ncbi:unnamed protein product [Orchesella dallaii]|uniref:Intraflagellar transport protein 46 homolog n=1 Tax=Orchesella dallaii TaxID=48710 RepID=A0ABP1RD22_9HEXA
MYDESIEVCDEDDDIEDEYELLAGRRRAGVSPVRRGPFRFQQQRPSRSFVRNSTRQSDSLEMSDEGSPGPPPQPPPQQQQQEPITPKKKSVSSKDFVASPSPQQSQDGGEGGPPPGNLISLASSYAKKLMSGSDKKEKPPADVLEATKRPPKGSGHEPKKQPPMQQQPPPPSSSKMPSNQPLPASLGQANPHPLPQQSRSEENEDDDDDEEEEYDDVNIAQIEGVYNPQDYEHLNVSPEVKELFHYITRYEPPGLGSQMDVKLKPFIPEYYPSVGDIDAFIKVTHPELQDDSLGIKCLDEPSPFQSDPSVLDLRLRALAKQSSSKSVVVKKIDNVGKNSKIIENWIKDISDLHRSKPSPSVHYSKPMPDIDLLIQEWPPQVEELLKNISLPSAELDCDLATYVDIVCNLLDIPMYKSRIQSLHVLFTLYATYKHFNHYGPLGMAGGNDLDNLLPSSTSVRLDDTEVDRLQIN